MIKLKTPIKNITNLKIGDKIAISGIIYTGRDAALPQLANSIKENKTPFNLEGIAIMHTAVSKAGVSPTTSNKEEIESTIPLLSKNGVKIHIGKGTLSNKTCKALDKYNSIYVIIPPVSALITNSIIEKKCVAYKNEGIEAIYKLKVKNLQGIVAMANGEKIFKEE